MNAKSNTESDIAKTLGVGHSSHRSRRVKRWFIFILLVAVVVVVVLVMRKDSRQTATMRFETKEAKRGDLVVLVTATGTLQPTCAAPVRPQVRA